MPWTRDGDGLKLVGPAHYEAGDIQALIEDLRRARNQPGTICDLIEQLLSDGRSSKDLVWRLSKWCDWNDRSEKIARSIAELLFHGVICRRLLDQSNKPVPDRATAEADYETWLTFVVNTSNRLACPAIYPDEIDQNQIYIEGAAIERRVNVYERNPEARAKCIEHYGTRCSICNFDFTKAYDGAGQGIIVVHHLRRLAEIGCEYRVDPIADLRPVCANCHLIIHSNKEPYNIDDMKAMVSRSREKHMDGPFA
jgi:hypothetical protein